MLPTMTNCNEHHKTLAKFFKTLDRDPKAKRSKTEMSRPLCNFLLWKYPS